MNTLKKILGLVVAVSMIQAQASQQVRQFVNQYPVLAPTAFAAGCWTVVGLSQTMNETYLQPNTPAGFVVLGLGTLAGAQAIVNSGAKITEWYNYVSDRCHEITGRSAANVAGYIAAFLVLGKAVRDNNVMSPLSIITEQAEKITLSTNIIEVVKGMFNGLITR